ncbi:unnamed protein product [Mytilus coruscus]|uniref:DUF6589 domain-containing protein n=1 Tax=Mytilus coruscus TaxID=42192 RepID=A0A6J8BT73_MYTCO|nr:unnamed protein product [Mytilus coruscus]
MALGYIAINRLQTTHLNRKFDEDLKKAAELPSDIFVPNKNDFELLSNRMNVMVARIITRYLPWFNANFSDCVTSHMLHEYSLDSSKRSVLINLGVFDVDPSSTQGAITIYENLQKYIQSIQDKPYTAIVYGDGLSCERGNDAHRARVNGLNPWERLEGCEPAVQKFHKEMILLQDYFDEFFKGSSAADKGTLNHLKNIFNFRQVKSDISDNFNHAWELMCLVTEGYVCLLTMELMEMADKGDRPSAAPESIENSSVDDRQEYLQSVVSSVVQNVWHHLETESLKTDDQTEPEKFCCGEDIEEDVILCGAGRIVLRVKSFTIHVLGWILTTSLIIGFAVTHAETRKTPTLTAHVIKISTNGTTLNAWTWQTFQKAIGTVDLHANRQKSLRAERNLSQDQLLTSPDFKYNYSRAITWAGLNLLCRRDAVREADGGVMMSHWKLDLVHFFSTKHQKYVILAHRLLVSINGWLPDKLKHDFIYNRTVNYGGGIGRNLPMDFMNEILNRLFKDLLDSAKGRYTNNTIQRCSQIVGPLGEALDSIFDSKVIENELYRHRRRNVDRDLNVSGMITFLSDESLFLRTSGRHQRAFPEYFHNENPKFPGKFQGKMKQLSKRLDKRRRIIVDA